MTPTETTTAASVELPRYRCHNEVHALKLARVELRESTDEADAGSNVFLVPEDSGFAAFAVDWNYLNRWKPEGGGYYVRERGGREIFVSALAFEESFTRL